MISLRSFLQGTGIVALGALFWFCAFQAAEWYFIRSVEAGRFSSPDGEFEAVIVYEGAGAFASSDSRVFIVAAGRDYTTGSQVIHWRRAGLRELKWLDNSSIYLKLYGKVVICDFQNVIPLNGLNRQIRCDLVLQ